MGRPIAERLDEVVTLAETFCEEGAFPSADAAESMANALQTLADRKLLARIELPLLNRILSLLADFVRSCESVNLFQVSIHFLPPSQQPDSVGVDAVLLGRWWNWMGERRWTKQAVTLGYRATHRRSWCGETGGCECGQGSRGSSERRHCVQRGCAHGHVRSGPATQYSARQRAGARNLYAASLAEPERFPGT